jgi:uncharacterized DUF497 family protein
MAATASSRVAVRTGIENAMSDTSTSSVAMPTKVIASPAPTAKSRVPVTWANQTVSVAPAHGRGDSPHEASQRPHCRSSAFTAKNLSISAVVWSQLRESADHDEAGRGSGEFGSPLFIVLQYCVRFSWDARKAAANLRKHGVSFTEAATAFDDELGAYYPDALHEDRFILIGYSQRQRLLYVVHAQARQDVIRIISARRATSHEKAHYEDD